MVKLKTFTIITGMGKSEHWKELGITTEQCEILNDIGYGSNKNYGRNSEGFENFLNTIDKNVKYKVICVRASDYTDRYLVVQINLLTEENSSTTTTVEGTAEEIFHILQERKEETFKVTISKAEEKEKVSKLEEQRKLDEEKKKKELELLNRKAKLEKEVEDINTQLS